MSGEELRELEPPAPEPEPPAPEPGEERVDEPADDDGGARAADVAPLVGLFVGALGEIVTSRARVSPLSPAEVERLTEAGTRVVVLYDFDLDPKFAAWAGLGLALTPVVAVRVGEYRAAKTAAEGQRRGSAKASEPKSEPVEVLHQDFREPVPQGSVETDDDSAVEAPG